MKTRDIEAPVAILSEPSSYGDALEHELSRSDISVHTAASWDEGRKLLHHLGRCLTLLDEELPGQPDAGCLAGLADLGLRPMSVFVLCDHEPAAEVAAAALKAKTLGCLAREAPFEETLFRIHAYLQGRSASQYRASPRSHIMGNAEVSRADAGAGPPLSGVILNLSRTGILIGAVALPEVGCQVTLRIDLPSIAKPIRARGIIVWLGEDRVGSSPRQAGIRFDELDPPDAESISRYVLDRLGSAGSDR